MSNTVATELTTRFAPSPTGRMHIGNARTALFNYLLALGQQGQFILRSEDTDQARSTAAYLNDLLQDLRALGINWQHGPDQNPEYQQINRMAIYADYYQQLQAKDLVYPCFCSEQSLKLSRKVQLASGQPPRYAGTCAHLTPADQQARRDKGIQPTLRFRVADAVDIEFTDIVRGIQRFHGRDIGDFIIQRADGTPAFFFANAIDDALMGVTHVMRGEDHLTNTPRQLLILQALNLTVPQYGHISLILGADGAPLSKRNGSKSIRELLDAGFLPIAIVNYMARLGHVFASNELMTLTQLAENFQLTNLGKAPARFDPEQLQHWQKLAVLAADKSTLTDWLAPLLVTLPPHIHQDFIQLAQENCALPEEAAQLASSLLTEQLTYSDAAKAVLQQAGAEYFQATLDAFAAVSNPQDYESLIQEIKQRSACKGKALFLPFRVALTGQLHGPELGRLLALMTPATIQQRFQQALTNSQ